jgi:hypothetical protein
MSLFQLSKALTRKAQWDDKDDLLEILYWGRQIAALLLGIVCGIVPLKGFLALLLYVGVSTFAGNYYVTGFQEVRSYNPIYSSFLAAR